MKLRLIILATIIISAQIADAQFLQNNSRSLFSDVRAFQEGDAITVLIMEDTRADNSANTQSSRESSVNGGLNATTGTGSGINVGGELGSGNQHNGRAQTARTETIRSRLSARVLEVEDNGNLRIEGTRTTQINGETQTIIIRGLVRPVDIRPDNSIYSYNILDLTLLIDGDGSVSEVQEPGLITRLIRILF